MLEGLSTCLSILGIELDFTTLQARLPAEKRERMIALLGTCSGKRFCKRRELESLIGYLHHVCKIAPQGRTFLRRMINLLCTFRRDDHPIRLNREFHLDLTWWLKLFQSWEGLSFFLMPEWAPLPDFQVSDLMLQGLWVMVRSSIISGSLVLGLRFAATLIYCICDPICEKVP